MVKKILIYCVLFYVANCAMYSQSMLSRDCINLIEGEFLRTTVDGISPGNSGIDCTWDFSNLDKSKAQYEFRVSTDSLGITSVVDDRRITYYITNNDSLLEIGYETPFEEVAYFEPIYRLKYPMEVGDSLFAIFDGYGVYCGKHLMKVSGENFSVADGYGQILLPESDTLKNVLRVYTLQSYQISMCAEPYKIDSIQRKQIIEESYKWYTNNLGYPVFETTTSTSYNDMHIIGTSTYSYCNLPDSLLYNGQYQDENEYITDPTQIDIIHYSLYVEGSYIIIDYSLDEQANITMVLANNKGMLFEQKRLQQSAG